jgi:signal transduction histidine kinase
MLTGYLAMEYAVHRWLIYPEYVQHEQQQAQTALQHAVDAIEADLQSFHKSIANNAHSGDYYKTLRAPSSPQFAKNQSNVDFLLLFDLQWKRRWDNQQGPKAAALIENQLLKGDPPFIHPDQIGFNIQQFWVVNNQFAWVAAEPILSKPNSRRVDGMVLAGYYISDAHLQALKDRLGLRFTWQVLSPEKLTTEAAQITKRISDENPYDFSSIGDNMFQCATTLRDSQGRPALLVKTVQSRDISSRGLATIYKWLLVKLGAGFMAVLLLTLLLQYAIIRPIMKLIRHIGKVEGSGSANNNFSLSRKDEIGTLAREFDHMCGRVQNAQVKLVEKSYYSGITEMSSGILHNVRNALSPITTRIERLKGQFRDLPLQHLEQAQQELQDGSLSTERRGDLIRFVELTFQNVVDNLKETVSGLEELSEQVIQIEDMLNAQKTFGGKDNDGTIAYQEPIQLVEKSLEMVPEQARKLCKVNTGRISKLPAIPVHTTTFTQVLQNLVVNAGESLERQKSLCPKISITCCLEPGDPVDTLHWIIEDNGAGIEPGKLKTIFERGASSKKTGLTGIGLHWCANTITAMRGQIWAESSGKHHGASFHIVIPTAAEESLAAAKEG